VARAFWEGIGCEVVAIPAEAHDQLMAGQSHLPHVAAFALAAALASTLAFFENTISDGCPTTSLRDTTRIAASSPSVWRDILLANRNNLLPLIEELEAKVRAIRLAVGKSDGVALERLLDEGRSTRLRLVKS
jgi:prephenate dehydrogenase